MRPGYCAGDTESADYWHSCEYPQRGGARPAAALAKADSGGCRRRSLERSQGALELGRVGSAPLLVRTHRGGDGGDRRRIRRKGGGRTGNRCGGSR